MENLWPLLWQLQELDQEQTRRLKERARALGLEERDRMAVTLETALQGIVAGTERIARGRSSFKQAELDLGQLEERITQEETRLYGGQMSNAKELSQLEHRLIEDRAYRTKLEERYLTALEEMERAEKVLTGVKDEAEKTRAAVVELEDDMRKRAKDDALHDRDYQTAREGMLQRLPEQQREKYERIQARYPGSTLVQIERGNCGGCHNSLARAEIERTIRLPGLSTCENCGRLLASEPPDRGGGRRPDASLPGASAVHKG